MPFFAWPTAMQQNNWKKIQKMKAVADFLKMNIHIFKPLNSDLDNDFK